MDGSGYGELLSHQNGAAHLGAWHAILSIASKCAPRGSLIRGNGKPHDAESLSHASRIPVGTFNEAIPRLVKVEWIEDVTDMRENPPRQREIPPPPAEIPLLNGMEWNGITTCAPHGGDAAVVESKKRPRKRHGLSTAELLAEMPDWQRIACETAWSNAWRNRDKHSFVEAWPNHATKPEIAEKIIRLIQTSSAEMLARLPDKRPYMVTFLNKRGYEDSEEPEPTAKPVSRAPLIPEWRGFAPVEEEAE